MRETPTMPPSSDDAAALEHAKRLADIETATRQRGYSGLFRALAEGWAAAQRIPKQTTEA